MNTRYRTLVLVFSFLVLVVPPVALADPASEWERLNTQAMENSRAGKCGVAAKLAEKKLVIAEEHAPSRVATSLNKLGELYRATDRKGEADKLEKRATAIEAKPRSGKPMKTYSRPSLRFLSPVQRVEVI